MKNYRLLTENEIEWLKAKGCTAENWKYVRGSEDFRSD
jgi:hypothetical protein